jgi:hypothetical protein
MGRIALRVTLGVIAAVIVWLFVARQVSMVLDRLVTLPLRTLPVTPLSYSPGTIRIADLLLSFAARSGNDAIGVDSDSSGRVALTIDGRAFALGTRIGAPTTTGFDFAPDQGDRLSLTVDRSIVSWPTPLDFNFMTGHSPSWRRHLYYRLRWTKASGAGLTLVWRFEQYFYDSDGWASGTMTREDSTGLIQAEIGSFDLGAAQ